MAAPTPVPKVRKTTSLYAIINDLNSDIEMFNTTTNYYINKDQPFMTYYLTVSGHLNYNFYHLTISFSHQREMKSHMQGPALTVSVNV